ncbi:MAG: agmatine deiminase family protein [Bacteroidota bacterium]
MPARLLAALLFIATLGSAQAQDTPWYESDPLPQTMTPEEELRRDEIGLGFARSAPPPGPVRNIAEFERSEAVLVRYPLGIPLNLVAALSEHVRVITTVASASQENQARSAYQNAGVTMANADFLRARTNSIWTRDYGPFYVADGNREISVIDFIYNRPRPNDNAVPSALAAHLGTPLYAMDLVHTGGNYMTDGRGVSASTDLVWSENGFNEALVLQTMRDYLGIDTYHVTDDPQGAYIQHIDTWGKFLDVDKVVITQVPTSDSRYQDYEDVAAYFAAQPSAYGTPYQVYRVYSPSGQPYANALIVNDRVYVPISNSSWDDDALDVYRAAMPGYEVLGFAGSWLSTDALHCRIKEVADTGLLSLQHQPLAGEIGYQPEVALDVEIVPYSGQPLLSDELFLVYQAEGAPFDTLALQPAGGDTFSAALPLPASGGEVAYYFSAADASGRTERFPLVGPAGARRFTVQPASGCAQRLTATLDDATAAPGEAITFTVTVSNDASTAAPVDLWLDATGPVSATLDLGSGTLPPGAEVTRMVRVRVPGSAPFGTYSLALNLGDAAAGVVCDTEPFSLAVSGDALGAGRTFEVEQNFFAARAAIAGTVRLAPNPFAQRTTLTFDANTDADARLAVYDVLGREVAVVLDGPVEAGTHRAAFDASGLAAGVYVYRLILGDTVQAGRMTLVR